MTEVDRQWGVLAVQGDEHDGVEGDALVRGLAPDMSALAPSVLPPDVMAGDLVPELAYRTDDLAVAQLDGVVARALDVGLRRVQVLAWRDFEDPEAGGSELHAHRMAQAWARTGIDISMRTSAVPGTEAVSMRDGYRVIRKSGRYGVFPRSALSGAVGRRGRPDGLIEIWNGMPFFSPLWARCP
ncbi:MAG: hypothetical protein ABSG81_15535, partial [Acidimicrobiales bacterium]